MLTAMRLPNRILAKYRSKYGLSACTKANGCFHKVNEFGEEKNYPVGEEELEKPWTLESALDMDMVSAVCPSCKIMLVEATTQGPADMAAATAEAALLNATEISNSYGYAENDETWCPSKKGCKEYLAAYNHPGIPVTVSAGDSGYNNGGVGAPNWPATSPNVIAVGGTSLKKAANLRGWSEKVWAGSGSGCSLYESKPSWQTDSGCFKRTDNDVAAVASQETPVSVYNSFYAGGWANVAGTSVSAPIVAGIEALSESGIRSSGAEVFWKSHDKARLFDVTEGQNALSCTEVQYLCHAEIGYDGPTGGGTPNGPLVLTGEWALNGVLLSAPAATKWKGKMKVTDASTEVGSIAVECEDTAEGPVGPGATGEVTKWTVSSCVGIAPCESGSTIEPLHLPWHTELVTSGGVTRETRTSAGKGAPGFKIKCKIFGIIDPDECTGAALKTTGTSNGALGVNFNFNSTEKLHCSVEKSGETAGSFDGPQTIEATSGGRLEVK